MISRKYPLKAIGIVAGFSLLASVACGQPADKVDATKQTPATTVTLDQQIEKLYPPLSKIPIVFGSYELENSIPEFVQNEIFQQAYSDILQYYETLAARGFPALPDGVSELTLKLAEKSYILPPRENLEQKVQTAQKTIEHMKKLLQDIDIKFPEVKFIVAQNS